MDTGMIPGDSVRTAVHDKKQKKCKQNGLQGVQFRAHPLAQLCVEHRRQGVDAGTFGKKGDGKIVERHGNRHQESGKYTGFDLRPGHLVERVHRSGTEI